MRHRIPVKEPPAGFCVLLIEEFGTSWFWSPRMTEAALEEWWRSVGPAGEGEAPLFFNTRNLPGRLVLADPEVFNRLYTAGGLWTAHAHWEDDSFLMRPDGKVILHRGHPDFQPDPDLDNGSE